MKTFSFTEHYCNKKLRIIIIKNKVFVVSLKNVSYSERFLYQKKDKYDFTFIIFILISHLTLHLQYVFLHKAKF
jgi:hypothetical protein